MRHALALALTALACGAADEPAIADTITAIEGGEIDYSRDYRGDLARLEQPIYMPYEYGSEINSVGGFGCIAPWAGGECGVPDARTLNVNVFADNCEEFTGPVIWDALAAFETLMEEEGWTVNLAVGNYYDSTVEINLDCGSEGAMGLWSPNGSEDCHDTQYGQLCQWRRGDLRINEDYIASKQAWITGTGMQRHWILFNILLHELFHAAGLGHTGLHQPPRLMDQGWSLDSFNAGTNGPLGPTWTQLRMLWCYNESSGTTMNCPP